MPPSHSTGRVDASSLEVVSYFQKFGTVARLPRLPAVEPVATWSAGVVPGPGSRDVGAGAAAGRHPLLRTAAAITSQARLTWRRIQNRPRTVRPAASGWAHGMTSTPSAGAWSEGRSIRRYHAIHA